MRSNNWAFEEAFIAACHLKSIAYFIASLRCFISLILFMKLTCQKSLKTLLDLSIVANISITFFKA